jgi:hypothetical protein
VAATPESNPSYFVGQFYGSGNVFFMGSGEMWRLRSLDDSLHERFATQLVRHVSQGRLLRGSRRARLLVDRDRFAVGATVVVRLVVPEGDTAVPTDCQIVGPDGVVLRVPLTAERNREGVLQGTFVAARDGSWRIDVDLPGGTGERVSRRIQAKLPDRELERPRLDRGVLEQLARLSGGTTRFLATEAWTPADAARAPPSLRELLSSAAPAALPAANPAAATLTPARASAAGGRSAAFVCRQERPADGRILRGEPPRCGFAALTQGRRTLFSGGLDRRFVPFLPRLSSQQPNIQHHD